MNLRTSALLATAGLLALGLAVLAARHAFHGPTDDKPGVLDAIPEAAHSVAPPASEFDIKHTTGAQAELARLKDENLRLQEELNDLRNEYLRVVVKSTLVDIGRRTGSVQEIESRWRREMLSREQSKLHFQSLFTLAAEIALLGDAGVDFLRATIQNSTKSPDERTLAYTLLTTLPGHAALNAMIDLTGDNLIAPSQRYEAMARHVSEMSDEEIRPYLPRLISAAGLGTNEEPRDGAAAPLIASLALAHDVSSARRALQSATLVSENIDGILAVAEALDTPAAHAFLEDMAKSHPDRGAGRRGRAVPDMGRK